MVSFFSVNEHPVERVARVGLGVTLVALAALDRPACCMEAP